MNLMIVLEAVKRTFGDYRFLILYGICLFLALILFGGERNERKRLVIPAVLISIVVLNPLFYQIWENLNEANVYWRTLWMIPILPVCAGVVASAVEKTRRTWVKPLLIIAGVLVISICGGYVYTDAYPPKTFVSTTKAEKLPEDVVNIGEALLKLDDHPRVVTDAALSVYLRQYSGRIQSPYSRSVTYGTPSSLGRTMYTYLQEENYISLAQMMADYDYEYLVTRNYIDTTGNADHTQNTQGEDDNKYNEGTHFERIALVNDYGIYRAHCKKTEKREYNDKGQVTNVTY